MFDIISDVTHTQFDIYVSPYFYYYCWFTTRVYAEQHYLLVQFV